jgi:phenylpropionate dioxygenase-like ring-hydroxylating dioxygenase large terminal subunit
VRIPSNPNAARNFTQRVYPVIERGPWIWIWTGDPAMADESKLPTLTALHLDATFVASPMLKPVLMNGRYMLARQSRT